MKARWIYHNQRKVWRLYVKEYNGWIELRIKLMKFDVMTLAVGDTLFNYPRSILRTDDLFQALGCLIAARSKYNYGALGARSSRF